MKTYKVWVRVVMEENDTYKNCIIREGSDELEYFTDSDLVDEYPVFESTDPREAQDYINRIF